jgi:hypothetical protein
MEKRKSEWYDELIQAGLRRRLFCRLGRHHWIYSKLWAVDGPHRMCWFCGEERYP